MQRIRWARALGQRLRRKAERAASAQAAQGRPKIKQPTGAQCAPTRRPFRRRRKAPPSRKQRRRGHAAKMRQEGVRK